MNKLIPMACLALPGTAGQASAATDPISPPVITTAPKVQQLTITAHGPTIPRRWRRSPEQVERIEVIRGRAHLDARLYETARSVDAGSLVQSAATAAHAYVNARQQPGFGTPGCDTFADGHKPFFSLHTKDFS